MKKIFLCALFLVGSYLFFAPEEASAQEGCGGTVYEVSIVGYNNQATPRYVFGFEATAVDYFAAICYDPEIYGYLDQICSPNGEGALGHGHKVGYAEWVPAVVRLFSTQYQPGTNYTSLGEHYIRHWFYGTRYYLGYTGVCIGTPADFCQPVGGKGALVPCPTPMPTPTPTPTPPTVQVQEVGFTGNYTVGRWDNFPAFVPISNPTWVRNGTTNDQNPVAYTKGTPPVATAKLTITPTPSRSIDALLRVKVGGIVATTQNKPVMLSGSTVNVSDITIDATKLESTAKVKKGTYNFDWEISLDSGQNWQSIGTSGGHVIYWTYGDVIEPTNCTSDPTRRQCLFVNNGGNTPWRGLYDLALKKAIGELDPAAQTPDQIAKSLAFNIDDQIDYNPTVTTVDHLHPLAAYSASRGVQCAVNANLLRGLLRSIGINNSEAVYIWGGKPNNTDKRENETGGLTYGFKVTSESISTGGTSDFYYSFYAIRPESNEGSFHLNKNPHFTFHAMVKVFNEPDGGANNLNAHYYDPSYAKRLQANPTRYPDYPYINENLKYRKAANLDNHDINPRSDRFVENDATKPFVVRALSLNNFCLPNGRTCDPNITKIKPGSETEYVAALPRTSVFDAQGVSTFSVWRPSDGVWYTHNGYINSYLYFPFGMAGDKPMPGDYDGDGVTDYAVFRPSNSTVYIWESDSQTSRTFVWNSPTDKPVYGDFDGDGKSDIAFYRSDSQGSQWYIIRSSDGVTYSSTLGTTGDLPVSGDFDGDGKTDVAVYRPSTGMWLWKTADGTLHEKQLGQSTDIPVPGDYDGDGKTDQATYSGDFWVLKLSSLGSTVMGTWVGVAGDIPVPGDYDGDGKTDIAVWSPSNGHWLVINSSDGTTTEDYWGGQAFGDIPVGSAFIY